MEKNQIIFVKKNDEYINGYQIRQFKEVREDKIVCYTNNNPDKELFYDFYQDFPDNDKGPFESFWKNSKKEIVEGDFICSKNTYA
jgi:hypothetical protein